jgi:tRNA-splicing ligase RtcB
VTDTTYDFQHVEGGVPIKMWTRGVAVDDKARDQLSRAAQMPFVFKHVAAMPDVHVGIGATVGSVIPTKGAVIPTKGAVIPAAVGVDIGCGMMAARTSLMASDLPDNLEGIRTAIEQAVPHGRSVGRGQRDNGSWGDPPPAIVEAWATLVERFDRITAKYARFKNTNTRESRRSSSGRGSGFA